MELLDRFSKKIQLLIDKHFFKWRPFQFVCPIDLLLPVKNTITASQLLIIGRMIDVKRLFAGKEPIWDVKFLQLMKGRPLTLAEQESEHAKFRAIFDSLKKYGFNYRVSCVDICTNPLAPFHGTHRCGYALAVNPYQVISVRKRTPWGWSNNDGVVYWKNLGMDDNDINTLLREYNSFIQSYRKDNSLLLSSADYENNKSSIEGVLNSFGQYYEPKFIDLNFCETDLKLSNRLFSFLINNAHSKIVRIPFRLSQDDRVLTSKGIRSKTIQKLYNSIRLKCYITNSVTDVIELEMIGI